MLIVCWLAGFGLGLLAAATAELSVVSLMRSCMFRRVSIFFLLLWCAFPLWITAWSVMIQKFEILLFLVFCRCFFFAFFFGLEMRSIGSGGWLLIPLSRFSDWVSLAAFCWLCLQCLHRLNCRRRDLWISSIVTVLGVIADYLLVSPFLAEL